MVSPSHAPNPMERVEETAHPRGKPGTPRNQTSNGLAMGHDQQSLLADSEITHSPPGPTHEILANPRFVISPRCLASLQDNLTNRRMRDPHVRWCERRAGKPGPPTRFLPLRGLPPRARPPVRMPRAHLPRSRAPPRRPPPGPHAARPRTAPGPRPLVQPPKCRLLPLGAVKVCELPGQRKLLRRIRQNGSNPDDARILPVAAAPMS